MKTVMGRNKFEWFDFLQYFTLNVEFEKITKYQFSFFLMLL